MHLPLQLPALKGRRPMLAAADVPTTQPTTQPLSGKPSAAVAGGAARKAASKTDCGCAPSAAQCSCRLETPGGRRKGVQRAGGVRGRPRDRPRDGGGGAPPPPKPKLSASRLEKSEEICSVLSGDR
jgi:hypothetical protein